MGVLNRLSAVAPTFGSTHTRPVRQDGSLGVHLCGGPGQFAADAKINVASSGARTWVAISACDVTDGTPIKCNRGSGSSSL